MSTLANTFLRSDLTGFECQALLGGESGMDIMNEMSEGTSAFPDQISPVKVKGELPELSEEGNEKDKSDKKDKKDKEEKRSGTLLVEEARVEEAGAREDAMLMRRLGRPVWLPRVLICKRGCWRLSLWS